MKKEVSEFAEDKAKVVAERVAVKNSLAEHSKMLENGDGGIMQIGLISS